MAEQILPNYLGIAQNSFAFGQQQGAQQRATEQRSRLAELAQQAYGTQDAAQRQGLIGQAVGVDPEAGFALDKQMKSGDERREQLLLSTARLIDSAPEQMKDAIFQRVRPQLEPYLPGLPPVYGPQVGEGVKAFIASRQSAQGNNVQSRFVGEDGMIYALMRDGTTQPLGIKADPNTQIIEGAGGFYGVNKRNLAATPVQIGGGQPPMPRPQQRQVIGPDGRPLDLSMITDPRMRAEIEANPAIWQVAPDGGEVRMPEQAPMGGAQQIGGGGQLQSPGASPPAGYQWNADRSAMVPIPGGPADKPEATAADVAKDEMGLRKELEDRTKQPRIVMDMYRKVEAAAQRPSAPNDLALIFAYMKMLDPGSVVREQEFANAQNAAGVPDRIRNAYNKALRGERLNEYQRSEFLGSAQQIANLAQNDITTQTRQYQAIADQYQYDPTRATGAPDFRNVTSGAPAPRNGGEVPPGGDISDLLTKYGQ